jgi:hypothetical protein
MQTAYNELAPIGFGGMKADLYIGYDRSVSNGEATLEMPFGVGVIKGASDSTVLLPSAAGQPIVGIVLHSNTYDSRQLGAVGLKPKAHISLSVDGVIYVQVEEAVLPYDRAFCRFAAGAGGTQRGAWRKSADTGTAQELRGARYLTAAQAGGVAVLQFNANLVASHL